MSRVRDEAITRTWLSRLARRDSISVLTHLFCELVVRAGHQPKGEVAMSLPLTQATLADATAMTSVHLNRVLQYCRERDLVSLRQGTLTIKSFEVLASFAGFNSAYLRTRFDRGRSSIEL